MGVCRQDISYISSKILFIIIPVHVRFASVMCLYIQVYLEGKWNTVCYDDSNDFDLNEATAKAVCRQYGYIDYNT